MQTNLQKAEENLLKRINREILYESESEMVRDVKDYIDAKFEDLYDRLERTLISNDLTTYHI